MFTVAKFIPGDMSARSERLIPYKIHQTFKTNHIPTDMYNAVLTWLNLNPAYDYHFYDDNDIVSYIDSFDCGDFSITNSDLKRAYLSMNTGAGKADLFRYIVMYQSGGIYMDIDTKCLKSFDSFIAKDDELVSGVGIRGDLHQWGLIYKAKHPFMKKTLENSVFHILQRTFIKGFENSLEGLTGPPCLDKSIKQMLQIDPNYMFRSGKYTIKNYKFNILPGDLFGGNVIFKYENYMEDLQKMNVEYWVKKPIFKPKMRILFQGWNNIHHSYSIVNCLQLIHLYKNHSDDIEFFIEEMPYYVPDWNNQKKQIFYNEYHAILQEFHKYNGEPIDLIYRIAYPTNINVTTGDDKIPKCIFYTSELLNMTTDSFVIYIPSDFDAIKDEYIKAFLTRYNNIYFTTPSLWSSMGITKYMSNPSRNQIITHGVDTSIFYKNTSKRVEIRNKYTKDPNDILMINIGAMTENKGIMSIIQTLNILVNRLQKPKYKLLLKGSNDLYKSQLILDRCFENLQNNKLINGDEMQKLRNGNIFIINDTLSFEDINDLYNACDLYISPYMAEGFNLTVLEAVAAGLNVLVPRTGSTREYIQDIYNHGGSEYIYYVDSYIERQDNGNMCNKILVNDIVKTILLNEEKIKMEKSNYCKMIEYIESEYSWNKVSDLLYGYFCQIIQNTKAL
jgi:mannosyltransferase OCH1-like enzyme